MVLKELPEILSDDYIPEIRHRNVDEVMADIKEFRESFYAPHVSPEAPEEDRRKREFFISGLNMLDAELSVANALAIGWVVTHRDEGFTGSKCYRGCKRIKYERGILNGY